MMMMMLMLMLTLTSVCIQVPGQPAGPSEAAPPISQLQPERRPHGPRPLQRGNRHRRAHPPRHHIHHPFCLHLLLHTSVRLPACLLFPLSCSTIVFSSCLLCFVLICAPITAQSLKCAKHPDSCLLRLCVRTCVRVPALFLSGAGIILTQEQYCCCKNALTQPSATCQYKH